VKQVRILGIAIVAVVAIAAVAATTAAALPEWGKCTAQAGGKYSDSNCTVKAKKGTGTFEFTKGKSLKNTPFSGSNVGSGGVLTTDLRHCTANGPEGENPGRITRKKCAELGGETDQGSAVTIECESEHNTGEATGANEVTNVSVKFHGCKLFGAVPCSNGPEEGEITVNPLKGKLGYIDKADKKVGLVLEPKTKKGNFANFTCGGILSTVVGVGNSKEGAFYEPESKGGNDQIISPITPVNTMTSSYEQVYTVNPETYENIPSKFEGKPISLLESYTFNNEEPSATTLWMASGEEITNVNTQSEESMIKA
jgi:hypothetical protein